MFRYRLSEAAQGDIVDVLVWTHERFGEPASDRAVSPGLNLAHVFDPGTCD